MPFLTQLPMASICCPLVLIVFERGKPGPWSPARAASSACVAAAISLPCALTSSYDSSENGAG